MILLPSWFRYFIEGLTVGQFRNYPGSVVGHSGIPTMTCQSWKYRFIQPLGGNRRGEMYIVRVAYVCLFHNMVNVNMDLSF